MSNLKELTKENHTRAERQDFVKHLMSGSIDNDLYATYLFNQFPQYEILEVTSMMHGLFNDMHHLPRSKAIRDDYHELWGERKEKPPLCPVVQEYLNHIMSIRDDTHKLMAHIYVRHMGDLSGGQMIGRKVPGEGRFYQFEDVDKLKETIRSKIDDSMADEARICFDFATKLFQQMMDHVK
jgi:heme oxygenase (biliverdin-producing, ferredoxin)